MLSKKSLKVECLKLSKFSKVEKAVKNHFDAHCGLKYRLEKNGKDKIL